MIDLTKLPPDDAERIAYAEGFTGVSELFARIADLEHALYLLIDAIDEGDAEKLETVTFNAKDLLP